MIPEVENAYPTSYLLLKRKVKVHSISFIILELSQLVIKNELEIKALRKNLLIFIK